MTTTVLVTSLSDSFAPDCHSSGLHGAKLGITREAKLGITWEANYEISYWQPVSSMVRFPVLVVQQLAITCSTPAGNHGVSHISRGRSSYGPAVRGLSKSTNPRGLQLWLWEGGSYRFSRPHIKGRSSYGSAAENLQSPIMTDTGSSGHISRGRSYSSENCLLLWESTNPRGLQLSAQNRTTEV